MSDHIVDPNKIPADGFYTALVQCDTGGEISMHVRVLDGIPRNARGATLRRDACRDYMPVCVEDFCRAWPFEAGMELSALRTGNAALVERLNGLQHECRLQQDLAEQAQERLKRLEYAGEMMRWRVADPEARKLWDEAVGANV